MIRIRLVFLVGITNRWAATCSELHMVESMVSTCTITEDVEFEHLAKLVTGRVLQCKGTLHWLIV
jgi:hypothetical protein